MIYIFLIAILNLGLGFAAAMKLGRCFNCLATVSPSLDSPQPTAPAEGNTEDDSKDSSSNLGTDDEVDTSHQDSDTIDEDSDTLSEKPVKGPSEKAVKETNPAASSKDFESDLDMLFENLET